MILLGDEIFTKVGGYLLGNVLTSVIAGAGTYLWMLCFGIPYPALLGLTVALLDLMPVIGSTIGGAIVTLVALTVSLPVAGLTLAFYVVYRLAEDYLLVPRIMGRTVEVPAAVTVVAVLIGAALLGLIGALSRSRRRRRSGCCCRKSPSAGWTRPERPCRLTGSAA